MLGNPEGISMAFRCRNRDDNLLLDELRFPPDPWISSYDALENDPPQEN